MFFDTATNSYTDIFGVMSYANSIMRGGFKGPQVQEWTQRRFQINPRLMTAIFGA